LKFIMLGHTSQFLTWLPDGFTLRFIDNQHIEWLKLIQGTEKSAHR